MQYSVHVEVGVGVGVGHPVHPSRSSKAQGREEVIIHRFGWVGGKVCSFCDIFVFQELNMGMFVMLLAWDVIAM